jgi:uncharacterized protein
MDLGWPGGPSACGSVSKPRAPGRARPPRKRKLQIYNAVLVCTCWGDDCDRAFDVVVNGVVVATQKLEGLQPGKSFELAYPLPPEALTGQQNLTVRFQGRGQGRVGGLLGLRLEPRQP